MKKETEEKTQDDLDCIEKANARRARKAEKKARDTESSRVGSKVALAMLALDGGRW